MLGIVQDYQSSSITLPKSEAEYQKSVSKEDWSYHYYLKYLKDLFLLREMHLLDAKRLCQQELTRINKSKCIESINLSIQNNAGEYLQASIKIGEIFEARKLKLTEARNNFTPPQMRRSNQRKIFQRRPNLLD